MQKDSQIFKGVIFDMDGVIVDSEPRHERAYLEIFQELGYGENHGVDFDLYYGRSDKTLWLDFMSRHKPPQSLEELLKLKEERFLQILDEDKPIFEGLPGLLERLASRYKLGVASGSWHSVINAVLELQNLRRYFSAVVSSKDVPREKPAPDIFLRAAELLGVAPTRCWVIEDSVHGVEGGRSAGMRVIGITNTFHADELGRAHHVVSSYAEIEDLLLSKRPPAQH